MLRVDPKINTITLVLITLIVGSLASSNTGMDTWYQGLIKSNLNPPGYVFGIVWPILYLFMGITAWRNLKTIKNLFYIQLFLNAIWSWLFFSFHLPIVALIDIWLLIFINIKILFAVFKQDKLATILYSFYVLWLFFASYLNLYIVFNNQINIPTIRPVMQDAKVAPTNALNDTLIKSSFLSGAIAVIPEINIPTDERLANPHKL